MMVLEKVILICFYCCFGISAVCQSNEKFEFVQSDQIEIKSSAAQEIKIYKGNVEFIKGEIYLYCDSLCYFPNNNLTGYGNVRIIKAGEHAYTLTGDQLEYDWKKNKALVKGNVFIRYKNKEKRRKQIKFKLK